MIPDHRLTDEAGGTSRFLNFPPSSKYASDLRQGLTPGGNLIRNLCLSFTGKTTRRRLMNPELISALEVILYYLMAAGTILAGAGLWIAFNQDKLSD